MSDIVVSPIASGSSKIVPSNANPQVVSASGAHQQAPAASPSAPAGAMAPAPGSPVAAGTPAEPQKEEPKQDTLKWLQEQAKKDKALRARTEQQNRLDAELKAREARLAKREKELQEGWLKVDDFQKDPFAALERAKLPFEKLTQMALTGQGAPKSETEKRIEYLEAKLAEQEKQREKAAQDWENGRKKSEQEAIENYKNTTLKNLIVSDARFVATKEEGAEGLNLVWRVIEENHKKTGQLMSANEAIAKVEKYYRGKIERISKALGGADGEKPDPAPAKESTPAKPAVALPKDDFQRSRGLTLTNNLVSESTPVPATKITPEERQQRLRESAARLLGAKVPT